MIILERVRFRSHEIPITTTSSADRSKKAAIAQDINQFLQNPNHVELELQVENQLWTDAFGFFLALNNLNNLDSVRASQCAAPT